MKIKPLALLNIILATVLVTSLFFVGIGVNTSGDEIVAGAGEYDPWLDTNDDGVINIIDIAATARAFGTSGDPTKNVNVTDWEPAWKRELYMRDLNITWKEGSGSVGITKGGERWFGGFSRMFVYLETKDRSESSLGHTITLWILHIEWRLLDDIPPVRAHEWFSPNVANMTIAKTGTRWLGGPYGFEMKGPLYNLGFGVESTSPSGWVTVDVYVYVRNE